MRGGQRRRPQAQGERGLAFREPRAQALRRGGRDGGPCRGRGRVPRCGGRHQRVRDPHRRQRGDHLAVRPRRRISYDGNRLKTAIRHANRRVLETTRESAEYDGMATTVAAVLVDGDIAHLAHVGDSRIYLWSGGAISQVTSDHSWVNEQIRERRHLPRAGAHPPPAQRRDPGPRRPRRASSSTCSPSGSRTRRCPPPLLGRAHHHGPDDDIARILLGSAGRPRRGRAGTRGRGQCARRRGQHHRGPAVRASAGP